MKFLLTLLSATALLASSISATPLGEHGMIEVRAQATKSKPPTPPGSPTTRPAAGPAGNGPASPSPPKSPTSSQGGIDYGIDDVIAVWFKGEHVSEILEYAVRTKGGWESWVQLELDLVFKKKFVINEDKDIREMGVYENPKLAADFLLPERKGKEGMIIEIKAENKNHKNTGLVKAAKEDLDKMKGIKTQYRDYTHVAVVFAFQTGTQKELTELGFKPIPKAAHTLKDGKGKVIAYRKDIQINKQGSSKPTPAGPNQSDRSRSPKPTPTGPTQSGGPKSSEPAKQTKATQPAGQTKVKQSPGPAKTMQPKPDRGSKSKGRKGKKGQAGGS